MKKEKKNKSKVLKIILISILVIVLLLILQHVVIKLTNKNYDKVLYQSGSLSRRF